MKVAQVYSPRSAALAVLLASSFEASGVHAMAPVALGAPGLFVGARGESNVVIQGATVVRQSLQRGGQEKIVFTVAGSSSVELLLPGAGALALSIGVVIPVGAKVPKNPSATIKVDKGRPKSLNLARSVLEGSQLSDETRSAITIPTAFLRTVTGKQMHRVVISSRQAIVLEVSFQPKGTKQAAPVVLASEASGKQTSDSNPLAKALGLSFDQERPSTPPSTSSPPAQSTAVEKPGAPSPGSPVNALTAVSVPDQPAAVTPLGSDLGESAPIREFAPETLTFEPTGETGRFAHVPENQFYTVDVTGPGVLTVRLHRVMARIPAAGNDEYSIVILEDDSILQRVDGHQPASATWVARENRAIRVAEPHEYRLQVGAKSARIAFQIAGAPEGMLIRHEYKEERASLTDISLSLQHSGVSTMEAQPTIVMEVDVQSRPQAKLTRFFGVAAGGGVVAAMVRSTPAVAGYLELRLPVPFVPTRYGVTGIMVGVQRQSLAVLIPYPDGAVVPVRTTVWLLPLFLRLTGRVPVWEGFALLGTVGGGALYARAARDTQSAHQTSTAWLPGGTGTVGIEFATGIGWLGLDAGYLLVMPKDFGKTLQGYTPGGPTMSLHFHIGI